MQQDFTHWSDHSLSAGLLSLVSEAELAILRRVSLVSCWAGLCTDVTPPRLADLQSTWHSAPAFPLSISASLALSTLLLLLQGCNLAILLCASSARRWHWVALSPAGLSKQVFGGFASSACVLSRPHFSRMTYARHFLLCSPQIFSCFPF